MVVAYRRFEIGPGHAVYRGPVGLGSMHRHAAFQIAIGNQDDIAVVDGRGHQHRGTELVIAPMVEHCLQASADVTTLFVEPHCAIADGLRERHGCGISAAPEWRETIAGDISDLLMRQSTELDPRLVEALSVLTDRSLPLTSVAEQVGLSAQTLRALARDELGMPLTRWRVWTRLRRAAQALQVGQSLAEAAVTAGFADQAHLTRQMRAMMGLTPATVLPLLRNQPLRPT